MATPVITVEVCFRYYKPIKYTTKNQLKDSAKSVNEPKTQRVQKLRPLYLFIKLKNHIYE